MDKGPIGDPVPQRHVSPHPNNKFSAMKVPRHCPLVLLVKVDEEKVRRSKMEKAGK
jgi:hypothetical protein